jgi:PAT family beta-lactamase induction signal transducer AmpG
VLTQLALAAALMWMAATPPALALGAFALLACLVAMLSASQDIVVDAYRTDLLPAAERGMGSSLTVLGYRLAMILSGGIAFIWVDPRQGGGWSWPEVYRAMALFMVFAAVVSALLVPRLVDAARPVSVARNDLLGFLAVAAAVALGFVVTRYAFSPLARELVLPLFAASSVAATLQQRWADLVALFAGIAFTLPLVAWAAKRARFETLLGGLKSYFAQPGARPSSPSSFSTSCPTPSPAPAHALPAAGDAVQHRRGRRRQQGDRPVADDHRRAHRRRTDDPPRPVRALLLFGVLQMLGNLGFWWLAVHGRGALPGLTIPPFDWGFVKLAEATPVDGGLLMAIASENITSGMGTAAFLAFLMSLCNGASAPPSSPC